MERITVRWDTIYASACGVKMTAKRQSVVDNAVVILADHMKKVVKEKGCRRVSDWYEVDRLDALFSGTAEPSKVNKALDAIEESVDCDDEKRVLLEDIVKGRLQSRFRIASFKVILPCPTKGGAR